MSLIKQKNGKEFETKRIGVTYLVRLENEAPLNENIVEETGGIHKRMSLYNGIEKAKRSGNSIKAQHRHAILDYLGIDETQCDPTVNACGNCLACALHGFLRLKENAMHSSLVSLSDMASVESADDCIIGLQESMLKSPSLSKGGSPQPFAYERVRAGTHLVGTAYLTFTGRKTMYEVVFENEEQVEDAFWYGMRAVLTNQTFQFTPMTARHDARFTPLLLLVSEVQNLPADIMVSPDLTKSEVNDMVQDLETKAKQIQTSLEQSNPDKIEIVKEKDISQYLNKKGHIKDVKVTLTPKKEEKDKEEEE